MQERGIECLVSGAYSVQVLERGIVCLVSGALALMFPVTVMCCHGIPGCFPESCPWVLSLGAVVIRHSLHVMSSVGRAQPGCPWAVFVLAVWRYQYPCGILQPHNDSEADMKSCGHSYSVQVTVWVDWHTPLKDDGGRNRNCPLALLHQVCLGGGHPVYTVVCVPRKYWSCRWSWLLLYCRFFVTMYSAQAVYIYTVYINFIYLFYIHDRPGVLIDKIFPSSNSDCSTTWWMKCICPCFTPSWIAESGRETVSLSRYALNAFFFRLEQETSRHSRYMIWQIFTKKGRQHSITINYVWIKFMFL